MDRHKTPSTIAWLHPSTLCPSLPSPFIQWPSTCSLVVSNKDTLSVVVEKMFKVHNSHPDVFKQAGAVVKEICKSPEHAKVRNSTHVWLYSESLACMLL